MAGKWEVGHPVKWELGHLGNDGCDLRELSAKNTLRGVRSKGHRYIDLRKDGKRYVFFCSLCLAPCYSEPILYDHLKGNLHRERYAAAEVTLLGPNPFPFDDGVLFCHDSSEQGNELVSLDSNQDGISNIESNGENNKELVVYNHDSRTSKNSNGGYVGSEVVKHSGKLDSNACVLNGHGKKSDADISKSILIPGVVLRDKLCNLEARFIGFGEIAARMCENNENQGCRINSMWCEWLGIEKSRTGEVVPEYDFGVVTFSYKYSLGKLALLEDLGPFLTSGTGSESEGDEVTSKKRHKSFSDPEDISHSLSTQLASNGPCSDLVLDLYDGRITNGGLLKSKTARRKLRRKQWRAARRVCDLCQQNILAGKDVSSLLNMKTGRLVCSSRNVNGAFHIFHTSCLIHWILLCEFEIMTNHYAKSVVLDNQEKPRRFKRKGRAKKCIVQMDGKKKATRNQIFSPFCPECQGTGIDVEDHLENPNIDLSQVFDYKIKISDARRAWMKGPETLDNCSTGLIFPRDLEDKVQANATPLKLLRFYRADV